MHQIPLYNQLVFYRLGTGRRLIADGFSGRRSVFYGLRLVCDCGTMVFSILAQTLG